MIIFRFVIIWNYNMYFKIVVKYYENIYWILFDFNLFGVFFFDRIFVGVEKKKENLIFYNFKIFFV